MINHLVKVFTGGKIMKVTKENGKMDYSMARVLKNLLMEQFLMAVGSQDCQKDWAFANILMDLDTKEIGKKGSNMVWVKEPNLTGLLLMVIG